MPPWERRSCFLLWHGDNCGLLTLFFFLVPIFIFQFTMVKSWCCFACFVVEKKKSTWMHVFSLFSEGHVDSPLVHYRIRRLGCAVSWRQQLREWFPKGSMQRWHQISNWIFEILGGCLGQFGSSTVLWGGEVGEQLLWVVSDADLSPFCASQGSRSSFSSQFWFRWAPYIEPQNGFGWKVPLIISPSLSAVPVLSSEPCPVPF